MAYALEECFISLILVLAWALWPILKRFIVKTSLDNVRGPPSTTTDSFIGGTRFLKSFLLLSISFWQATSPFYSIHPKVGHSALIF